MPIRLTDTQLKLVMATASQLDTEILKEALEHATGSKKTTAAAAVAAEGRFPMKIVTFHVATMTPHTRRCADAAQRSRTVGACRRLAAVTAGWTAVRVRGLTRGGYREQVRGYARDKRNHMQLTP